MYKLLIIDDEEKIVDGIGKLFPWESIGFTVVGQFTDAKKALRFIEKAAVDVVLTDIEMPGMDGLELARRLMDNKSIKVVLFSSHSRYEYFRGAIQFKTADYLLKPVDYFKLLECFERIKKELDLEHKVSEDVPTSRYDKIIYDVMTYLKLNYQDASLEDAAEHVNLSPSYLSRMFKEKSGQNFSDVLTSVRMEKACEMLIDPQYKGYDIAYYLGYDNPKNFSRAFRTYYNMTPSEYRKEKLGGAAEE